MSGLYQATSTDALLKAAFGARPMGALIELADRCNESCIHCYQVQGKKGEMTTEQVFDLLDELAARGILMLTISGGEATLRRDYLQILRRARELRFAIKVFTNGLTMTEELAAALAELGVLDVQISIYSSKPERHDWITNVPGSWAKSTRGVRWLTDRGVRVLMKTPMFSINHDERDQLRQLAESLGAEVTFDLELLPREDGDRSNQQLTLDDDAYQTARRDTMRRLPVYENTDVPPAVDEKLAEPPCGIAARTVVVEPNGVISPCTQFQVPLGATVDEALDGEATRFLRSLRWKDIRGCRACDLRRMCHRCLATGRTEVGDALAPYPSACRRTKSVYESSHGSIEVRSEGEPAVGPYRQVAAGVFEKFDEPPTDDDEAMRKKYPWLLAEPAEAPEAALVPPGSLVRIRRPGRKLKVERTPV